MINVQILEDESYIKYADFDNSEVWLLNKTTEDELDPRIVNVPEVTESLLPSSIKFPQLLTHIYEKHPGVTNTDSEGNFIDYTPDFDYEVISSNVENFSTVVYVCDKEKIHDPLLINYGTEQQ